MPVMRGKKQRKKLETSSDLDVIFCAAGLLL